MELASTGQPRRVKVYEMRGEAWSDRGTGFCMGAVRNGEEAWLLVKSEEDRDTTLLESAIIKDDLYQVQQNTLIVWQELDGTDVALSFQEEEGCFEIWSFLRQAQRAMNDELSDDDLFLPEPALARLGEIEEAVQTALMSVARREALTKYVLHERYIAKLTRLLDEAEARHLTADLHRLCNILKSLVLLNDASIFDSLLAEDVFLGAVGIFEYDPEFPHHKAQHRRVLKERTRFKEVVPVKDADIRAKIRQTFRLQYMKDVILARILDDPTFSILNSLIFFNQVDIVQHFQHDEHFLEDLFALFDDDSTEPSRRADAVTFMQQSCQIAKTLQLPARISFYQTIIQHGLFKMLGQAFGEERTKLPAADILICTIDHDPRLVRAHIMEQGDRTLLGTLVDMLVDEPDLGVKSQVTDAIRYVVDPSLNQDKDADERFLELFYAQNVATLMQPLEESATIMAMRSSAGANAAAVARTGAPGREGLSVERSALLCHLLDLLCFFLRAHTFRCKFFVLSQNVSLHVGRLLSSTAVREKHLRLAAVRYFRTCVGLQDEFYDRNLVKNRLLEPLIGLLEEFDAHFVDVRPAISLNRPEDGPGASSTTYRVMVGGDNLLSSATLELFDYIRREKAFRLIDALREGYRDRLANIRCSPVLKAILEIDTRQPPQQPPAQLQAQLQAQQQAQQQQAQVGMARPLLQPHVADGQALEEQGVDNVQMDDQDGEAGESDDASLAAAAAARRAAMAAAATAATVAATMTGAPSSPSSNSTSIAKSNAGSNPSPSPSPKSARASTEAGTAAATSEKRPAAAGADDPKPKRRFTFRRQ